MLGLKTALRSTHVFEQLLFSIVLSILTFDFLGHMLTYLNPNSIQPQLNFYLTLIQPHLNLNLNLTSTKPQP